MEWVQIFPSGTDARQRLVENRPQLLVVHGRRICLVLREGRFYAVQDACTHNSTPLSNGSINYIGEIICPLHGYRFNLMSGRESDERSRDLETFPVRDDETGFYIGI